jgi:hypothetical protein
VSEHRRTNSTRSERQNVRLDPVFVVRRFGVQDEAVVVVRRFGVTVEQAGERRGDKGGDGGTTVHVRTPGAWGFEMSEKSKTINVAFEVLHLSPDAEAALARIEADDSATTDARVVAEYLRRMAAAMDRNESLLRLVGRKAEE